MTGPSIEAGPKGKLIAATPEFVAALDELIAWAQWSVEEGQLVGSTGEKVLRAVAACQAALAELEPTLFEVQP